MITSPEAVYEDERFTAVGNAIVSYHGKEEVLRIPHRLGDHDIWHIKEGAFAGNPYLKEVIVPKTIRTIADEAFCNCGRLQRVTLLKNPEKSPFDMFSLDPTGRYDFREIRIRDCLVPDKEYQRLKLCSMEIGAGLCTITNRLPLSLEGVMRNVDLSMHLLPNISKEDLNACLANQDDLRSQELGRNILFLYDEASVRQEGAYVRLDVLFKSVCLYFMTEKWVDFDQERLCFHFRNYFVSDNAPVRCFVGASRNGEMLEEDKARVFYGKYRLMEML